MTNKGYSDLVATQREYFLSGHTRSEMWRRSQLGGLKALFQENHDELCDALWKDLRRNVVDADLMDVGYNAREADYALKHLTQWLKPEHVPTPLVFEPGHVRVRRDPYGVALIIGTWNEPFMLLFGPLVAALAGGNVAVLKPSELAPACSAAAARLDQFRGIPVTGGLLKVDDGPPAHTPANADQSRIAAAAEGAIADGLHVEKEADRKPWPGRQMTLVKSEPAA